jgi:hypothetical protein
MHLAPTMEREYRDISIKIPADLSKIDVCVLQRQLARSWLCGAIAIGRDAVLVDEIRHTLASHQSRRSRNLEMQMRLAGVAGIANSRQYLATPNARSCLPAQTARLQMTVVRELPATQVEYDGVPRVGSNGTRISSGSGQPGALADRASWRNPIPTIAVIASTA